ncbi:MAG: hypothetical protein A2Y14_02500 [Verrucomicrobia bacterium GWF2_51_19]|nr:MAG: hypothetical protein A2Y14_02500 [Verrucomicrobia bacterium GWF2_51_19]
MHALPILIFPAYQPLPSLLGCVRALMGKYKIIVVDDGSTSPESQDIFKEIETLPSVIFLRHAVNMGKGAALKTVFNYTLLHFPKVPGVVTADADGQHTVEDIDRIAQALMQAPSQLILGTRHFSKNVPFRNYFGNKVTSFVCSYFVGRRVSDTQTGLRGIPLKMLPQCLQIDANRYDFELEMLLVAKNAIRAVPIATLYGNDASSSFHPILDSVRVYFVFLRFATSSLVTSALDFLVFSATMALTQRLFASFLCARVASIIFNFCVNKTLVFKSHDKPWHELAKYLLIATALLWYGYQSTGWLVQHWHWNVYVAKIFVESFIFALSFLAQSLWCFHRPYKK